MIVRDAVAGDEAAWRDLWHGYLTFYERPLPEAVTAETWRRLLDPGSAVIGRVAEDRTGLVGFCHCILHDFTWAREPACYLEDLFVRPDRRGGGIGRALIEDAVGLARARRCARLYWHTQESNATARKLYDSFAPADGFVRYMIGIDGSGAPRVTSGSGRSSA